MADVNATFVYDADFTSAISQTRLLSRELSTLNNSFNSLDKDARKVRDRLGEIFKADVGDLGAFSARTVDITSNMDNFGKALDRNKLKLRDYAREARKAFQADSNSRKLAEDQVRRSRASLVEMGMDASGRRKGILVTPLKLDMSDMQTQLEVSRKQFSIFNKLVNDGATQLINWGKNTQWAGRQLTVGLTVPMTIFATTTIKAFNEVDKELTRFQKVYGSDLVGATTQATNAIRAQVQALAVDIAGAYGVAAKETAGLAADLAATGLEGQKLLDSIKQTTRLSVLGEIDRQDAMKTTLSLQNAFNMSTQELAESINFLNAVENQTSLSLQDLTEAIPKVGPVVRALGGDVKDLSVLMVAMKEGGINAAEGANALKSGLASLINPTKAGSEVAKQYGIDLEDIVKRNKGQLLPTVLEFQKSMQTLDDLGKAKIIEQLFGKYQFARISALFDNLNTQGSQTKQVIELMSASNTDLARIANAEIKTLTESASMRFQRSMEAIKAALLPVGEAIVNSVLPFMERFAGVLDRIVSFAKNLPGPIKSFLKIAGGLTAIAGPLIMMTGVLGNFLGYIVKGAMAFVNLGRTIRGLPVEKFSLMDDAQIAASKATDTVTISIEKQKSAMIGLNKLMMDYYTLINKQAARTPNLFNSTPQSSTIGGSPVVPKGVRTLPIIRRQSGGAAYVPGTGSGDKIPALLEPGEFVINREATKQYGGLLEDINNGTPRFQSGGKMPRKIPVPGYMSGFTGRRMAAYNARYNNNLPARQPVQQPNPGGQPLRYGNEAEWERNLPSPMHPDGIAYGSNITHRRVFQARQANEQISVIMSRLQNSQNPQDLIDSIPQIIGNIQTRTGIKIREVGETKSFPASSTYPMSAALNTLYNQILPGKTSDTRTFSSILTRIANSDELTLSQKKSLFNLVSNGDSPGDPELVRFMSTVFRGILDEGLPGNFSQNVAAKMALAATVPGQFKSQVRPMSDELGDIVGVSTDRSASRIIADPGMWTRASKKLGLQSLPLSAQVTASDQAAALLARSLGIDEDAAKILIKAQKIGEFHVSHAQSGGVIKAIRGVKMPESYATKLATIRQSMANANKEAMSSNVPLMELGTRQSRIGGYSSAIPGVNGVYEINGQRYVVKGHDTYESAKAEADMARITREVFGLQTPNQEAVRIRHPETGELMFAVRSPYNEAFAKTTGRFTEDSAFDQLIASVARRDKDLQADNLFDNIVTDVGQAGIMSKASQPRTKTGPGNSALEQLAINLGMTKGGARSHGAEAWNAATANMTDDQIISRIKEAAAKAKSKLSTADIPEDFKYIARDLDDIVSADLGPFVAHLRTVFPKEKKPATAAAIAKKEQQKLLDREERQSALDAGYPAWAMQSGGLLRAQDGAWVPGKGEGDRVPALLEPGEFVVNKKAAMKYGGMLEDMNWNVAPRFMRGTPPMGQMPGMTTGAVSGGLMAASMASSMMLPVNQFTDALNKSIMALSAFTGILSALQMLGGRMGGGIGEKLSGVMTAKDGSKAARFKRSGDLYSAFGKDSIKTGGSNLKSVVGKGMSMGSRGTALKTGIGAVARGGAMLGMGSAFGGLGAGAALATNPVGWAILAIGAATLAITKYKKSLDSAKKSAEQAFGASKAEAEAFGVELKNIGETIKANQEYTKMIGAQAQQSQSTSQRLDPEKESALLGANEDLTKRLRNLSETRLATTVGLGGDRSAQAASLLTSKYASLIQQGFSEEDANVMVRTLAKASGAMDAYAQSVNKFGMIKADDPASIIKAQMEGVKTFSNIGGLLDQGERGGFAAGIKSVVEQINLLPPEDQYTGLKALLTQMENLDTKQLKIAQQAIVDMTKETYGEGSQLFNTQRAIQERTNNSFSFKNLSTYDDVFTKVSSGQGIFGGIENELATRVSAALTSAFETGAITDQQLKNYELRIEADPSSISQIEAELDTATRDRQIKIEATIKLDEQLAEQYEKISKEIIVKQNDLQAEIEAKNAAIEKEEEAFKASQKAGQKFIKGKQEEIKTIDEKATKEIEAIEKQTNAYLKALTKEDDANKFRSEQRGTMLGGLGALAEGDVFGFLDARQAAEENARQFSASEEIKVIEEKRKAATEAIDLERDARIEAIQAEIDKKQEALERQAEGHEAHMTRLQKERDTMATNASKTIAEMQATADSIAGIKANPVILDWLTSMKDKGKAAAAQAALINYLVKHPEATVTEALNKVRSDLLQSDQSFQSGMTSNDGERAGGAGSGGQYTQTYTPAPTTSAGSSGMTGGRSGRAPGYTAASGGYIQGVGTSTSDSIPARLSDGEYVIKASAVDQYGVGMMNSINEQKFADGGQVLDDYSRVTYGGKTFNARTVRMLKRAEESYGSGFGFYQGSYSTGIAASKGTHDGGGAVDIKPPANIDKALKALASAGFWAKWRGSMNPPHIHALATGDAQLSSAARRQLGLPADGGYEGDQIEVGTRSVEDAIKEAAAAGQGTIQELTNLMAEGAAAVYTPLTGRRFGGSMTMNKPYLVGENGPEVVMPYGSGSKVDPRFNVPSGSSIATVSQDYGDIINSNSYSNMVVNLSVSGVNDPNKAADRVIEILNKETGRRNHSRKMSR
jgi:TP901 family phage tail tape measure protein